MHNSRIRTRRALAGGIAALALIVAACGSDDDTAATNDSAPSDSSSTGADTQSPQRIISLSATHTEILFAIGAEDQLIAVDSTSNYPDEALDLPHELSAFEPNVEAIVDYEPDLVLIGGDFTGLGDQLAEVGIESWDGPAALTIDDTYAQIEQLGAITGHVGEAAELVANMQADIETILADVPESSSELTFYHELGSDLYSADSTTFIGEIYSLLGLQNIADTAEGDHGGYPQLNAEFIVSADPDLIFLADTICCGESLETVAARPGWEAITAVVNGDVIEMSDDVASRWGPRVVDYLAAVAEAVELAAVAG